MGKLYRIFIRWSSVLNSMATFWLFSIMVIIIADVIGRGIFNRPLMGTPEIVKASIVGITFIQLPHSVYVNRTIRSDALLNRMRPFTSEVVTMISYLMGMALCLAIFVSSWSHTKTSWQILEYEGEGSLHVPAYPIRTLILVGAATTGVHFIVKLFGCLITLLDRFKKKGGHES